MFSADIMDETDSVFEEDYEGLTEGEESDIEDMDADNSDDSCTSRFLDVDNHSLGISIEQANANYDVAGTLVNEEKDNINVTEYSAEFDISVAPGHHWVALSI